MFERKFHGVIRKQAYVSEIRARTWQRMTDELLHTFATTTLGRSGRSGLMWGKCRDGIDNHETQALITSYLLINLNIPGRSGTSKVSGGWSQGLQNAWLRMAAQHQETRLWLLLWSSCLDFVYLTRLLCFGWKDLRRSEEHRRSSGRKFGWQALGQGVLVETIPFVILYLRTSICI
jgi:hypothetical protein